TPPPPAPKLAKKPPASAMETAPDAKSTVTTQAPIAEQPTKPAAPASSATQQNGKPNDSAQPLSKDELRRMNAYWRAANYLSVGQIYLCGNPMLREPLELHDIKSRLLGHWGTTPGPNFIYLQMHP